MRKPMLPTVSFALSCTALGLAIFNGAVLHTRIQQVTQERDIYASRFQNWSDRAIRDEETISALQDRLDSMADGKVYLEEAGVALLAEGVDRNSLRIVKPPVLWGRPPRGGRG